MASITTLVVLLTIAYGVTSLPQGRIVGGETANPGQFPHQISIRYIPRESHSCGGSIIRPTWILTAAHCVDGADPLDFYIITGAHRWKDEGTSYEIAQFIPHEEYDNEYLVNDIALVETRETIEFSPIVAPISIGDGSMVGPAVRARASGWGRLYYMGPLPDELQYIDLITLSNADCKSRHGNYAELVNDGVLCAYSNYREQGMCHGDSGGPLVSDDTLIGVVSFGEPCAAGRPDGFSRVSVFLPWILSHVDQDESVNISAITV